MTLSPIDVEILRNQLNGIVEEAYIALMQSAYSTNIKERRDHSAALFDAVGRAVVQGESLPLHLASILGLVRLVLHRYGAQGVRPGDMFVSNDPFVGKGSHLPDVAIVAPVFCGDRLALFVGNIAHHADIGGMAPGSMAGGMTEVFQEGLRIPPIRLVSGGEIVRDVFDMILLNVRVPEERLGDYMAQIAANRLAERRCHELFRRQSLAHIEAGIEEIIAGTERRVRASIARLPDGEYRFADVMDDDGLGKRDIPIAVSIEIRGEEMTVDFTGSSPQVLGNINVSEAGLQACVLFVIKSLIDPDAQSNHGTLAPVRIVAPSGTIVNAAFPAATAARANTAQRIIEVMYGALAEAIPQRVTAAGNGSTTIAAFSGHGPDGRYYLYLEVVAGGAGARSYKDGTDGVQVLVTNTTNLPIEALESEYPLLVERYELVPDSGGAGTWRGGLGMRRVYRAIDHTLNFSGQADRFLNRPWGLFGGEPGETGSYTIVHDDGRREPLAVKPPTVAVPPSAVIEVVTTGAGGYGLPASRARAKLDEDCRSGKFSAEFLRKHYGYRPDGR